MEQIYNYIRLGFIGTSIRLDNDKLYMLMSDYVKLFSVGYSFRSVDNYIRDRFGKEYLCIYNSCDGRVDTYQWNERAGCYL